MLNLQESFSWICALHMPSAWRLKNYYILPRENFNQKRESNSKTRLAQIITSSRFKYLPLEVLVWDSRLGINISWNINDVLYGLSRYKIYFIIISVLYTYIRSRNIYCSWLNTDCLAEQRIKELLLTMNLLEIMLGRSCSGSGLGIPWLLLDESLKLLFKAM